jgi:hypothetical protein
VFVKCLEEYWYPFPTDQFNATSYEPLNFAKLNPEIADKRIIAKGENFAYENGTEVKFYATNFVFAGNFIDNERSVKVAKKLASHGVNLVRFHHADFSYNSNSIWVSPENQTIDQEKLKRMHFLIYQLKLNGIYSNINLHVSRTYPGLGEEFGYKIPSSFIFGKGIDQFYDEYIEMQKQYAIDLLTSVNPYTGYRLADDPCIAFVEINNENSIFNVRNNIKLLEGTKFGDALHEKAYNWLESKYGTYDNLWKAWNPNPINESVDITEGVSIWYELYGAEKPTVGADGVKNVVTKKSTHPQGFASYREHYDSINIMNETFYTVKFRAKCDPPGKFKFYLMEETSWRIITNILEFSVTSEWADYSGVVKTTTHYPGNKVRTDFELPSVEGTASYYRVRLYYGKEMTKPGDGSSIRSIPIDGEYANELNQFFIDTETATHRYLMDVLKKEIKIKSLATSSQADYGSIMSLYREGTYSDYTDTHFYYQHPSFDPGFEFMTEHFYIGNTPLIKDPYYLLYKYYAKSRIVGKPMSVSEINMPFPNEYQHELFPIAMAGAAWQNIAAIYQFNWDPDRDQHDYVDNFFTYADNPVMFITSKVMAYAYRKGYIKASQNKVISHLGLRSIEKDMRIRIVERESYKLASYLPFQDAIYYTQFHDDDRGLSIEYTAQNVTEKTRYPLITEQLEWVNNESDAYFKTVAPNIRTLSEFMNGEERELGDVKVRARTPERYTASVIVESLDDLQIAESESIVVVVASTVKNEGAIWDENRTTTKQNWARTCAMHLYVDFEITIPGTNDNVTIYRLTSNGEINGTVEAEKTEAGFKFSSNKEAPTMWYHIVRKSHNDDHSSSSSDSTSASSSGNGNTGASDQSNTGSGGLGAGIVAVIVIAVIAVVAVAIISVYFLFCRKDVNDSIIEEQIRV